MAEKLVHFHPHQPFSDSLHFELSLDVSLVVGAQLHLLSAVCHRP